MLQSSYGKKELRLSYWNNCDGCSQCIEGVVGDQTTHIQLRPLDLEGDAVRGRAIDMIRRCRHGVSPCAASLATSRCKVSAE